MDLVVAAITIVGMAVMVRLVRIQTAMVIIALVLAGVALVPSAGAYAEYVPGWLFWGVVVILALSALRAVLGALFGRSIGDSIVAGVIKGVLAPVTLILQAFVKAIFRMR